MKILNERKVNKRPGQNNMNDKIIRLWTVARSRQLI